MRLKEGSKPQTQLWSPAQQHHCHSDAINMASHHDEGISRAEFGRKVLTGDVNKAGGTGGI